MSDVVIAGRKPVVVDLEPGDYFYCSCGRSQKQPFCDGSHRGTGLRPVPFSVETKQQLKLCLCKHTEDAPYCDGSHHDLD
tara:strand:- start:543 stop:782 length:240 start_codon:yes stop_codon:yes gene_type:complete